MFHFNYQLPSKEKRLKEFKIGDTFIRSEEANSGDLNSCDVFMKVSSCCRVNIKTGQLYTFSYPELETLTFRGVKINATMELCDD